MADLNSVQSFSPTNFNLEPVVKRNQQQGVNTPLSMLELANTARSMTALQKEQALLEPGIKKGIAESEQQVLAAEKAGVDLNQHYANLTRSVYGGYLTDPDFINGNSAAMVKKLNQGKSFLNGVGVPEYNKGQAHKELVDLAEKDPKQAIQFIKNITQQGVGNVEQAAQLNKAPTYLNLGNRVEAIPTSPYQGVNPNAKFSTGLSPQIFANPITGAPMVMGGGGGGSPVMQQPNAPQAQVQPQNAPQTTMPQSGGQPPAPAPTKSGQGSQLQQLPNESPANFNARVAQVQNSFVKAQDQFNNTGSEFGHIPTIKNINNNIISLLKDPDVNTGSVQNFLSKKLGKENLSPKEQELAKYLGQRVQNLSPKSDADAANKKEAYGNLQMKKEALMDLVRQDQAWVTSQELQAKGVLNNGGSATNPNFGKVADFNNKFTQFASDPALMKYIAIIGDNPGKASLDASDIADLKKDFGSLSKEKLQQMELKRKTLLKLVNGDQ